MAEWRILHPEPVVAAVRKAATADAGRQELLDITAREIQAAGPPYTSVYAYMLHGNDLILEAYSGRETDHTSIAVGHGVCGTAVATGLDQNVPDVRARENYIACNTFTRSELVVLIRKDGNIIGQIDVDSDQLDPFTEAEVEAVQEIAAVLGELL